jgi:ComF family protein
MKPLKNILHIFFPEVCLCCDEHLINNENTICLNCRHDLPLSHFCSEKDNLVEQTFYGRIPLKSATTLFFFVKKGKVQQLIHHLKYNKQQQVGIFIGNWLGDEIIESRRFENLDCIIPVPLHKKKLKKRGYNQVTTFGESLSIKLNIPFYENILTRISSTKTQTKKIRLDRWKNVQELFFVQNNLALENKHILLIDDIITTGATLIALNKTKNLKVSIACMAYTK